VLQDEYKLVQRMMPMLQKVLIVDPFPASTRLLSDLMRNICPGKIWTASSSLKENA